MEKHKWIIEKRIKLNYGNLKQVGDQIIYCSESESYSFEINVDINRIADVVAQPKEHKPDYNNGIKIKRKSKT
jgi:hypothetical protein